MPAAAVLFAPTSHPGMVTGPGVPNVRIGGLPAVAIGDMHVCAFPVPPGHPPSTIATGSATVRIGGRFAARVGDICGCGAQIMVGVFTVNIN